MPTQRWLSAGALALASLLIFALALAAGERAAKPAGDYVRQLEVRTAARREQSSPWHPIALHPAPVYRFADAERAPLAIFRHQFDQPGNAPGLGLYLTWKRRVAEVRLNGEILTARTPVQPPTAIGGFDPVIYELPSDILIPIGNVLEFQVLGSRMKILPAFFVGPIEDQFAAYAWSRAISVELVVASIGVMLFVALLCLALPWYHEERSRARALGLLLAAWSLRNLSFFGIDVLLPPAAQQVFHYQVTFCFLLALAWFAAAWTRSVRPGPRVYRRAALGLVVVAVLPALLGDSGTVFRWLFPVESLLTLVVVVFAGLRFLTYASAGPASRRYEAVLFCICLSAVGVDALDDRFHLSLPFFSDLYLTFYTAPVCGLLLALASVTILMRQSQRARLLTENLNEVLDRRLADQELALRAGHEREQAAARTRAVLEERQRLMRDMHDGLGGQLTSLLVRLRRGRAGRGEALIEVGQALDDLRLIVASLDHAEENLGIALGAFRERMEPRLREAGVSLTWRLDGTAAARQLEVASMLHVLRFLQEACSNVLRHANATHIELALTAQPDGLLEISVADNGDGIDPKAPAGRGLKNMQERAERLGGTFERRHTGKGTRVAARFPIPHAAERTPPEKLRR
ncbi:MAG: ATP-binding protein [Pseudomonadota bacterium]